MQALLDAGIVGWSFAINCQLLNILGHIQLLTVQLLMNQGCESGPDLWIQYHLVSIQTILKMETGVRGRWHIDLCFGPRPALSQLPVVQS